MRSTRTARIGESPVSAGSSPAFAAGSRDLRIVESDDERITALLQLVLSKVERLEQMFAFVPLLIAQTGRCTTHVTVEMAAIALGVSTKTIRRRIREKRLILEKINGTRLAGIRIDSLFKGWLPIDVARRLTEDVMNESAHQGEEEDA